MQLAAFVPKVRLRSKADIPSRPRHTEEAAFVRRLGDLLADGTQPSFKGSCIAGAFRRLHAGISVDTAARRRGRRIAAGFLVNSPRNTRPNPTCCVEMFFSPD